MAEKRTKLKKSMGPGSIWGSSGRINYWMGMLYSGGTLDTESRRSIASVFRISGRWSAYDRSGIQLFIHDRQISCGRW